MDPLLAKLAAATPLRGGVTGNVPDGLFTAPTPAPTGVAEAALAFIHDQPPATTNPALQLVTNNEESIARAAIKDAQHDAILKIDIVITTVTDPEVIRKLRELKEHIREAKSPSEISAVLASVSSATSAAVAGTETPQQRVERLQVEIAKLEKENNDDIDALYAKGYISREDYENRKRRKDSGEWTTDDEKKLLIETRKKAEQEGDMVTVKQIDTTIERTELLEVRHKELSEAEITVNAKAARDGLTLEEGRKINDTSATLKLKSTTGNNLDTTSSELLGAFDELTQPAKSTQAALPLPTTRLASAAVNEEDLGRLSTAASNFSLPKLDQKTERT